MPYNLVLYTTIRKGRFLIQLSGKKEYYILDDRISVNTFHYYVFFLIYLPILISSIILTSSSCLSQISYITLLLLYLILGFVQMQTIMGWKNLMKEVQR